MEIREDSVLSEITIVVSNNTTSRSESTPTADAKNRPGPTTQDDPRNLDLQEYFHTTTSNQDHGIRGHRKVSPSSAHASLEQYGAFNQRERLQMLGAEVADAEEIDFVRPLDVVHSFS